MRLGQPNLEYISEYSLTQIVAKRINQSHFHFGRNIATIQTGKKIKRCRTRFNWQLYRHFDFFFTHYHLHIFRWAFFHHFHQWANLRFGYGFFFCVFVCVAYGQRGVRLSIFATAAEKHACTLLIFFFFSFFADFVNNTVFRIVLNT